LTPDEYYLLRYSIATESALMEIIMGEVEGFTHGTVPEIIERLRSNIVAKKQAKVDTEKAAREAAESELGAMRERDARRRARMKSRARRYAHRTVLGIKISLIAVLALATAYSFGWGLPFVDIPRERYLGVVPLLILLALSVANFWDGTTVKDIGRKCEVVL
jgi:Fe2+ transport system protein B